MYVGVQDWPIQGGVNLLPSVGNRELLITGYVMSSSLFYFVVIGHIARA